MAALHEAGVGPVWHAAAGTPRGPSRRRHHCPGSFRQASGSATDLGHGVPERHQCLLVSMYTNGCALEHTPPKYTIYVRVGSALMVVVVPLQLGCMKLYPLFSSCSSSWFVMNC